MAFIEGHKARFGVEPICRVLTEHGCKIAPSTYYAARHRQVSALRKRDAELTELIRTVHAENYGVYGYRKVWHELTRRGVAVGRETVARLMGAASLAGVSRSKSTRTTRPAVVAQRPADLLERDFTAAAPNSRWVADISYVWTWTGFVYVAFVTDLFSRRIIGWRIASSLRTDLALDALEHGLWQRAREGRPTTGLVHHSDRGAQGGFQWSSQHLYEGVCDGELEKAAGGGWWEAAVGCGPCAAPGDAVAGPSGAVACR